MPAVDASNLTSLQNPEATRPDASVVIVTHNNHALIADCLRAVESGFERHTYEILIVDNGSNDNTLAAIPGDLKHCRVIALETNLGFAQASNLGIEASRGRLIVLVNSDAFPDPGSIDQLIDASDELPNAGIVGARLRYPTGEPQSSVSRFPSLLGGLWVALFLHRIPLTARLNIGVNVHPALYRRRRKVDWVTAAFCIARRDAGKLPAVAFMYGEEIEWAFACRQVGLEVWLEPAATAIHIGRASVDQSLSPGFAQEQRVRFELSWFGRQGAIAQLAARGVLAVHALVRLVLYAGLSVLPGHGDSQVHEYTALLRSALSWHSPRA